MVEEEENMKGRNEEEITVREKSGSGLIAYR